MGSVHASFLSQLYDMKGDSSDPRVSPSPPRPGVSQGPLAPRAVRGRLLRALYLFRLNASTWIESRTLPLGIREALLKVTGFRQADLSLR